jgi:hypothetical protein
MFYNFGLGAIFAPGSVISLPGCAALCPLDTFVTLLSPLAITPQQYVTMCAAAPAAPDGFNGWAVGGPVVAAVGLGGAWLAWRAWRRRRASAPASDSAHLLKGPHATTHVVGHSNV